MQSFSFYLNQRIVILKCNQINLYSVRNILVPDVLLAFILVSVLHLFIMGDRYFDMCLFSYCISFFLNIF